MLIFYTHFVDYADSSHSQLVFSKLFFHEERTAIPFKRQARAFVLSLFSI